MAQGGTNNAPTVRVVDADTGAPLTGNVFGGTFCALWSGDPAISCNKLADYDFSKMLDTSTTTGLNEVYMEPNSATGCADSNQSFTLRNLRPPTGHRRITGSLKTA